MIASKPLSLVAQDCLLRRACPAGHGFIGPSAEGRRLRWQQTLRPHSLCAAYEIELRYAEGRLPVVLVRKPDIQALAGERKLPHTFEKVDGLPSLCLWWKGDWNPTRPVATTIVPWAAEWLWFFEHWLVTGAWLGGGTHATPLCPPSQDTSMPSAA